MGFVVDVTYNIGTYPSFSKKTHTLLTPKMLTKQNIYDNPHPWLCNRPFACVTLEGGSEKGKAYKSKTTSVPYPPQTHKTYDQQLLKTSKLLGLGYN